MSIKEQKIKIKISSSNYKFYNRYKPYKVGDEIEVYIKELPINSTTKVTAICKICNSENKIKYQNYNVQKNRLGFYCCKKCKYEKSKISNLNKYGVEHPLQDNDILNKQKKTFKDRYGVENPSQLNEIREKRSKRLSDRNYQKKMKNGVLNKYGVGNVSSLEEIKNKKKETTLLHYGVENPSQSEEIFIKSQKSGKKIKKHHIGLFYRGTYEKDFLDFCFDNDIKVDKGKTIKYIIKNKEKFYHSDFYIEEKNLIVEIKSSYYFEKLKYQNLKKKEYTIKNGFNYIIIIDKKYDEFLNSIKK